MPFYFFNDVFLLHFPLKAAQSTLQGFPILEMDFCQIDSPPSGIYGWTACALRLGPGMYVAAGWEAWARFCQNATPGERDLAHTALRVTRAPDAA